MATSSGATYTIGETAKAAGVTTRAVRLYETRGLLAPVARTASGYRLFTDEDVNVLAFVRRARALGLSIDAIGEIVALAETGPPCARTRALLTERVAQIDAAIDDLTRLRDTIVQAQSAPSPPGGTCGVIEHAAL